MARHSYIKNTEVLHIKPGTDKRYLSTFEDQEAGQGWSITRIDATRHHKVDPSPFILEDCRSEL
jgi:hypothetical protein